MNSEQIQVCLDQDMSGPTIDKLDKFGPSIDKISNL